MKRTIRPRSTRCFSQELSLELAAVHPTPRLPSEIPLVHSIREGQTDSLTDGLYSHAVKEALNLPTQPLTVPPGAITL